MGCGLSSTAATGNPPAPGDPEHPPHHHDEHAHRHNRPVHREPRPLNSRHPSPTGSRIGSQWLHHPESPKSHNSSRRGSNGHQFLQVGDAGMSGSQNHHLSYQPLNLEHLPLQLLQELNRQRRDAFSLTGEAQQLTLRDEACHVAKEAAKATAEAAKTDDSRPPESGGTHGYLLLSRSLTLLEAHNLPLFLVNLMTEVKSKSEESSGNSAASDMCFWTQTGHFGCAAVLFARKSAAKSGGDSNGSVKQGVNGDMDQPECVAIAMAFRPSD